MIQDELIQLIDRASVEEWTELSLSGFNLEQLPPQICDLLNLVELDLSKNRIQALPPEICQLRNLVSLDLRDNRLSSLTEEIGQLKNLSWLDLGNNELATLPLEIGSLTNLINLDLRYNQLDDLGFDIGNLANLYYLDLSLNRFKTIPNGVFHLAELSLLDLSQNQLQFLPIEIGLLRNLIWLSVSHNKLENLPPEIGSLIDLDELHASNNLLESIPKEISNLTKLVSLSLSNNRLKRFPKEICLMQALNRLDLSGNQLKQIPNQIEKLQKFVSLNLKDNSLLYIPDEIGGIRYLNKLFLGNNRLQKIPPSISNLVYLEEIDLNYNSMKEFPMPLTELYNLVECGLGHNQISELPIQLRNLVKLRWLILQENPLPIPSEVLAESWNPKFILETYFSTHQVALHEAKMLLVGQGGVGKTSLARRLLDNLPPSANQGKTEGVDIHQLKVGIKTSGLAQKSDVSVTLNLWDFGGQDIYQATHQFFFTTRSLYLVVISARTGERESRLHHWLKLVSSLSDSAPVIIVVNQIDQHPGFRLDERDLKDKYRNLIDVLYTSCTDGAGIEGLRRAIANTLSQMPHIHDRFPVPWYDLKTKLERMHDNYITYEQYAAICAEAGISEAEEQRLWIRVLHELGVILNYQDDRLVADTHVLNPDWVTEGVYRILSDPGVAKAGGLLAVEMLDRILDPVRYPRYRHHFILGMMQRFELCYPILGQMGHYLLPDLLPVQRPNVEVTGPLAFEYRYNVLPESILSRFMVGMMAYLNRAASWRNGAALLWEENEALVRADAEIQTISIQVGGAEGTRRSLLNSIRMQLAAIHHTFPGLEVTEYVPLPGHPGHAVKYNALLNHEKRGRDLYYDGELDKEFDVRALLDGIESPEMRLERQLQETLLHRFNRDELEQLCFKLDLPSGVIPEGTMAKMTRELVEYMRRHGRLTQLQRVLGEERPYLS